MVFIISILEAVCRCEEKQKRMSSGGKEESDEFGLVSLPYAGADPWAVMIVDFDADTTIGAMERARWPYQLASITIGKLILVLIALQTFR